MTWGGAGKTLLAYIAGAAVARWLAISTGAVEQDSAGSWLIGGAGAAASTGGAVAALAVIPAAQLVAFKVLG